MKAVNLVEVRRAVRTGLARMAWESRRMCPGMYHGRAGLEFVRWMVSVRGGHTGKPTPGGLMGEALAEKRRGGDRVYAVELYGAALVLGASSDPEMDRFVDVELFSRLLAS